jgi:hypothetical protein
MVDRHQELRWVEEASATACAHTLSRAFTSIGSAPACVSQRKEKGK